MKRLHERGEEIRSRASGTGRTLALSAMFSRSLRLAVCHARQRPVSTRISLRTFSSTPAIRVGDSPTKFTNILAGANVPAVQIKTVTSEGVQLEDGLIIPSSCLFIEGKIFLWDVPSTPWEGWKPEHFEIFDTVVPKPGTFKPNCYARITIHDPLELVLLGTGKRVIPPPPHIRQYLSNIGIQIDVMDTVRAPSV